MKNVLIAIGLSLALPSIAHAQAAPTTPVKEDCCEKMKAEGKKCCCDEMEKKKHSDKDMKMDGGK